MVLSERIHGKRGSVTLCDDVKKGGRKSLYESHVKPHLDEITEWRKDLTEAQIAKRLGIGKTAFGTYKKTYSELAEALKKGERDLVTEFRSALVRKALGFHYTETKTITEQVRWSEDMYLRLVEAGFTEREISQARLIRTEVSEKYAAPDVAAINLGLKNYDKKNWANDPQTLELKKKELELREKQIENNMW